MTKLEEMLTRHEGIRLKPYVDSVGKTSIGVGRNLDDVGISPYEASILLKNDIIIATQFISKLVPSFDLLSEARRDALVDMGFNLGEPRFRSFKKMISALTTGDFETAAKEMLASKWASQVGGRANELATMILTGVYHDERKDA